MIGLAGAACLFSALWAAGPLAQAAGRISQQEFRTLLAEGPVSIVDTRSEHEFAEGRIPGAVSLPDYEAGVPTRAASTTIQQLKASGRPVVVYCACPAEGTSLRVARLLMAEGIAGARALTGGWVDWFNDGNPVERSR